MRILFSIHLYLPQHAAGGEMYCHNIAKFLVKQGHHVRVLLHEASYYNIENIYDYEGVEVFPPSNDKTVLFGWADIVLTHLVNAAWTVHVCNVFKKPCIFISHNTHPYDVVQLFPKTGVIYNSHAMRDILQYENKSIVVHPAIKREDYDFGGPTGEYITLVNLNANKGGKLFADLAKAMPDRKFLGVGGSYDPQYGEQSDNLTLWPNSPDMKQVYENTRILLVPSKYESWGMCATEAMCNGIPIIYHDTFGLRENVGESGIMLKDQNPEFDDDMLKGGESPGLDPEANLDVWVKAIKRLDNPNTYKKYSNLSRERSCKFNPQAELMALEQFIYDHQFISQ